MRRHYHRRVDVLVVEQARAFLAVAALNVVERAHKPLNLAHTVAYRYVSQYVTDVAQLNLNVVLVAQKVVNLNSSQADIKSEDGQFCGVEIVDTIVVNQLFTIGVEAADFVYFGSRVFGNSLHFGESLFAVDGQIAPRDVETRQQQIRRACGLCQVDDLPNVARAHAFADEQERTLCQASARFVHTD